MNSSLAVLQTRFLMLGVSLIALSQQIFGADKRPNVLLILSDDHSAPYLGCYGNPDLKTPNLDKLANEGVLFTRAYVTAPQSVPSRASLMTGRSVVDVDMLRFTAPLDKQFITFPELLRKQGYYTGLCGRSYHLDGDGNTSGSSYKYLVDYKLMTFSSRFDYVHTGNDDETISQFEEFLNQPRGNKPFFMQAGFNDPHRSFTAPEYEPNPDSLTIPSGMPDTKLLRKDLSGHYGEIQRLDLRIGKLLNVLKKKAILDNTIIIFMGDNGAALLRGKGTLYEHGIHVPLIMRFPKTIKAGTTTDALISGEDIGPTVLDMVRIKPDPKMTGKSFFSVIEGDKKDIREYAFAVRGTHASILPGSSVSFDLSRCVISKKFKFIYNPMFNLPYCPVDFESEDFWKELVQLNKDKKLPERFSQTYMFSSQRPMFELYDLENDPNEFINLSGKKEFEHQEKTMKTELLKWMILNRDVVPLPITTN